MFSIPRHKKLGIFFISAMCFSLVRVHVPGLNTAYLYLSFCFLLSEMGNMSSLIKEMKKTVLWTLIIVMIIATIVLWLNSPHYNGMKGFVLLFYTELLTKYFVIAYSYCALSKVSDLRSVYTLSLIGLFILSFFAVINFLFKQSDFVSLMTEGQKFRTAMDSEVVDLGKKYTEGERFRVQGMFVLAFDYGYVCAISLLFYCYGWTQKILKKKEFLFAIICCVFGILSCNCRTVLFSSIISVSILFVFLYGRKSIKYAITICVLLFLCYFFVESFQDFVDSKMLSIFQQEDRSAGSTVGMRTVQYAAVFMHVQGHELFGNGHDYFLIDMGWKDGRQYLVDDRLEGIEGIVLKLILERGFMGVMFWLFFYFGLLWYFLKNKTANRHNSIWGISCIVLYLIYSNMTGEMGCVFSTMLVLGIALKIQYLSIEHQTEWNRHNIRNEGKSSLHEKFISI